MLFGLTTGGSPLGLHPGAPVGVFPTRGLGRGRACDKRHCFDDPVPLLALDWPDPRLPVKTGSAKTMSEAPIWPSSSLLQRGDCWYMERCFALTTSSNPTEVATRQPLAIAFQNQRPSRTYATVPVHAHDGLWQDNESHGRRRRQCSEGWQPHRSRR